MGRLLRAHPCPVCNYHIESELYEGNSGIDPMFLRNHYALAICAECHQLVSVLVPNTEQETQEALRTARREISQMEADAVIGDERARTLLPLFRAALEAFDESVPQAATNCSYCGSAHVQLVNIGDSRLYDIQRAWVRCPRCEEGRLLIETIGTWD
ncbi:MAG: hypothetical protein RML95_11845 [Anaerolineae bacterium]|nr:hypothetical protein [Anaerolineae bacterium]MDW8300015.1 hypothetical protein [Anaerolineae bacterium]